MQKATISQLKNRLSAYLKKVRNGETILVFDRNRPVARIDGVSAEDDPEGRLTGLEARGLLLRARRRPVDLAKLPAAPADRGGAALAALLEEREHGR